MSRKRIFISYDYDNDRVYKNMLLAWNSNTEFDFEFYDGSLRVAINSENASYVRGQIRPLILKSTHLLCVVGQEGATNEWINWEVQTAVDAAKKLIGVKLGVYRSPPSLLRNKTSWATSFNFEAIKRAVNTM